jgi:uncharacterized protein (TIGR03437 family)
VERWIPVLLREADLQHHLSVEEDKASAAAAATAASGGVLGLLPAEWRDDLGHSVRLDSLRGDMIMRRRGELAPARAGPGLCLDAAGRYAIDLDSSGRITMVRRDGQPLAFVPVVDGKPGTQVQIKNGTLSSDPIPMPVFGVAPSIFSVNLSGTGPSAVLNQDGLTLNSAATPAAKGSVISIYATGEGQTNPGGQDGMIAAGSNLPAPMQMVAVRIDGKTALVTYAGAAPGQVAGLLQVNVKIPEGVGSGAVPIEIQVGDATSQPGMTISVK